jgi:hypothetical protein
MARLSDWIVVDEYCATRVIEGTDPDVVANRVAFIEKTPRVCVGDSTEGFIEVSSAPWEPWTDVAYRLTLSGETFRPYDDRKGRWWIEGPSGSGGSGDPEEEGLYGFDAESRAWCDKMLIELGHTVPGSRWSTFEKIYAEIDDFMEQNVGLMAYPDFEASVNSIVVENGWTVEAYIKACQAIARGSE